MAFRFGTSGDDTLNGTGGFDLLFGFAGADALFASGGSDLALGGDGNDTVDGGSGNDTLFGDAGNDSLVGGSGADLLIGGLGEDMMTGGKGNDVYLVDSELDAVVEADNEGVDLIRSSVNINLLAANVENLVLTPKFADGLFAIGNDLDNLIIVQSGGGAGVVDAGAGNDTLVGGDPFIDPTIPDFVPMDTLAGGSGHDLILGGAGDDFLDGGGFLVDGGNDTIRGDEGDDALFGGAANDLLFGGADDDFLSGDGGAAVDGGADTLMGDGGNDGLIGGAGGDSLNGGTGNDSIVGGDFSEDGNDTLVGGAGNDTLHGDLPSDPPFGPGGVDVMLDGAGNDQVRGFAGVDEVRLSADGETDFVGGYFIESDLGDQIFGFDTSAPGEIPPFDPFEPPPPLISGGDILVIDSFGSPPLGLMGVASAVTNGFLAFGASGNGGTNILLDFDGGADNLQVLATLVDVTFSPTIQATLEDNILI